MGFSEQLQSHWHPEWKPFYVDMASVRTMVHECYPNTQADTLDSTDVQSDDEEDVMRPLTGPDDRHHELLSVLRRELQKVDAFFTEQEQELQREFDALMKSFTSQPPSPSCLRSRSSLAELRLAALDHKEDASTHDDPSTSELSVVML